MEQRILSTKAPTPIREPSFILRRLTIFNITYANSIFFCFLSFQQFFQILDWAQTYYEPFLSHRQLMS